jgi:hypothetical protein
MSTGENINANGALLTEDMIRAGFFRFPQSVTAKVNPGLWMQIISIQLAPNYPFAAERDPQVPAGEVWFIGADGAQLGRIINLTGIPVVNPLQTQDDSVDFVDDEHNPQKIKKQKDRRIKDALL